MEQFSLEKHLENPSRKVVTREGRPVRIVCWDLKSNTPIIAAIQWNQEREDCYCYNTIGRCANNVGELDLFFADEEKELTEFEKAIKKLIESCCNEVEEANITNAGAKEISSHILDLARKEIRKEQQEKLGTLEMPIDVTEPYYIKGKQDALKDLPKLEKTKDCIDPTIPVMYTYAATNKTYVEYDGHKLCINDVFEKLPKEE